MDDSAGRIGGIERTSQAGDKQQTNGASSVAEDPAFVAIEEAGSFLTPHGDKFPNEEPVEATDCLSGNGRSNAPWSANLKEEGSETVAQLTGLLV